jgi:carbonic anhydrase
MKYFLSITSCCLLFNTAFCAAPSESLEQLLQGNRRYIRDELLYGDHSSHRREELAKKQKPYAVILGCSDSRVAPEIIFDQGLGDLFIVRVAGNVAGATELDSIDYAVKHLGSSLVIVLGHTSCGAVTAVMEGNTSDIKTVSKLIKPAIKGAKNIEEAVKDNVRWAVASLKKSPILKQLIAEKKVDCIGAYYHLGNGTVEILE